jgi:integrase
MITDAAIRKAQRDITAGRKTAVTLSDPAPRGAGRLVLIVKPDRAEWYAQRWSDGRRRLQKLGVWPTMTPPQARERHAGIGRTIAPSRGTVGQLFDAYLETLKGRESYAQARNVLREAGERLGASRAARDITPADIVAAIRPVYTRGAVVGADKHRAYLSAAFGYAVRAANDYTKDGGGQQWGVTRNPVADVPQDASSRRVGKAWARPAELVQLLDLLAVPGAESRTAALLMAVTGQRGPQIRAIHASQWDSADQILEWSAERMKSAKPHAIPVCAMAAAVLDSLKPDADGWLLGPIDRSAVSWAMRETGMGFTVRDLRRTWKTLAGAAGLTKAERDQYQHHGVTGDVAERHYNRWDGMPEKRAAVAKWDRWLEHQRSQQGAERCAQQVIQAEQDGGGE